jgi:hypothetical protein
LGTETCTRAVLDVDVLRNTIPYITNLCVGGVDVLIGQNFTQLYYGKIVTGARPRRRGGVPRGRSAKGATRQVDEASRGRRAKWTKLQGGEAPRGRSSKEAKRQGGRSAKGAKRHGTMESTRGHLASRSDDGDELERSDEGWLGDGASAGTPCRRRLV